MLSKQWIDNLFTLSHSQASDQCRKLSLLGLAKFSARLLIASAAVHTGASGLADVKIYTSADPPYVNVDAHNKVVGGLAAEKIFKMLDILKLPQDTVRSVPWARGYNLATTQAGAMVFPIAKTKQRLQNLHYAFKLTDSPVYFYKLSARSDIQIASIDDAKKYSVCAIHDDYRYEYLQDAGFKKIDAAEGGFMNIKKFLSGRCDLVLSTHAGLMSKLQKLGAQSQIVTQTIKPSDLDSGLYAAFNKNTPPEVIEAFKKAAALADK